MNTVLKMVILLITFTFWIAYVPFLPTVVPQAITQAITLIIAIVFIWYALTLLDVQNNWG